MAALNHDDAVWESITPRRAWVLRELADGHSLHATAARLNLTYNGVRSHVQDLKVITGCESVSELGRFWRRYRGDWLRFMAASGGARVAD